MLKRAKVWKVCVECRDQPCRPKAFGCFTLKLLFSHPQGPVNLPLLSSAAWAKAVAALMIIGLLVLIVAFIVSCVALCCSLNIPLLPFVGVLLIIVGETASRAKTCNNHHQKLAAQGIN